MGGHEPEQSFALALAPHYPAFWWAVSGEAAAPQALSNSRRGNHTKRAFEISLCLASAAYRTDERGDGEATNMKVSPR